MLTYEEAVTWIHSRLRLGIKPGLQRMNHLLEQLGNPQTKIKTIHIGGTNGKGSTVTYLRNVLQESGYSVGTFTSPYFERFNERISSNGKPISDHDLTALVEKVMVIAESMEGSEWGSPSEFEVITAMSFYYFAEMNKVDVVLYEVGLGGRLDSTNVITPLVSVITSIGMDHMQYLGDRIEDIAFEKAGIIKERVPVVSGVSQKAAQQVIKNIAEKNHSDLYQLGQNFSVEHSAILEKGERFTYLSQGQKEVYEISMIGTHQVENAGVALKVLEILATHNQMKCNKEEIKIGMKKAYWPGRMEQISTKPAIILDGAHNPEGITALVRTIKERFHSKKISVLFSALKDKELKPMISLLDSAAHRIAFTSFDFPRVASSEELFDLSIHHHKKQTSDWMKYLDDKIYSMDEDEVLFITGSLYFLSEVKPYIQNKLENS